MIIDTYVQFGPGLANHKQRLQRPITDLENVEALLANMDKAGIDMSMIHAPRWVGGAFEDPTYVQANKAVAVAVAANKKRLIGFARVNPNYGEAAAHELEKCFTEYGFRGLMMDAEWENFDPMDKHFSYPLYEIARAHKAPILFHTWYSPSQPALYWQVANDFPEVPVIISHLGGRLIADATYVAQRAPNVYLETSDNMYGVLGPTRNLGAERILFGSNAPFSSVTTEMLKVRKSYLSKEEQGLVLGGNAARLFGLN
jgi:predicted TIM-barrel fold metal-dependent hydrolase